MERKNLPSKKLFRPVLWIFQNTHLNSVFEMYCVCHTSASFLSRCCFAHFNLWKCSACHNNSQCWLRSPFCVYTYINVYANVFVLCKSTGKGEAKTRYVHQKCGRIGWQLVLANTHWLEKKMYIWLLPCYFRLKSKVASLFVEWKNHALGAFGARTLMFYIDECFLKAHQINRMPFFS